MFYIYKYLYILSYYVCLKQIIVNSTTSIWSLLIGLIHTIFNDLFTQNTEYIVFINEFTKVTFCVLITNKHSRIFFE